MRGPRVSRRAFVAGTAAVAAAACDPKRRDGRHVVSLWYSYGGKNRQVLEGLVRRFHAEQDRVFVDATFQGDYFECLAKLRTAMAAGLGPTLSHVVGEVVPYLHEAGVLEPLGAYPGAGELDLVRELAQEGSYDGASGKPLVAIPFNRSTPIMYVNQRALDEASVRVPTSWEELVEAAAALTGRGGASDRHGFACPISWWFWVALVGQAGGSLVAPDGRVTLGGDAGRRAIELWQRLVHVDRSMRLPPGRDYDAWQAAMIEFLSGRAAILWSSTAFVRYVEENATFPVRAAPLPRGLRPSVPTGGTSFVVLRAAPEADKAAAWEFLRWMTRASQTREWAEKTGYLPVSRAAVRELDESGHYARHPNDRVALTQLRHVQPWPWSPELFRVQREIVDPMLEEVVTGNLDAGAALARAVREAEGA